MVITIAPLKISQPKVTALYLGAEVDDKLWFPVKKMIWRNSNYHTSFVGGVKDLLAAAPLWRHYFRPEAWSSIKTTHDIHCDYACRMPLDRPQEMPWHLPSLGLPSDLHDPILFVARSGGYRETDSLDIFPEVPAEADGSYRFYFLLRKLYLVDEVSFQGVLEGDLIDCLDWWAVHQPTGRKIGILPGYIRDLVTHHPSQVNIKIQQVNNNTILQNKLLLSLTCQGFTPFSDPKYLPLGNLDEK